MFVSGIHAVASNRITAEVSEQKNDYPRYRHSCGSIERSAEMREPARRKRGRCVWRTGDGL